jgi:serine/threonine-protein kinase
MEYLSKGSIQKHIEKRFISVKEACRIVQESLLGLEHSHNGNFLHRDIKPGNILFGEQDEAKLSDFGLAINQRDGSDLMGYRPHQPLEVIEGEPMDKLSDIYGMGITMYRLLNNTNQLNFNFTSIDDWKKAVKKDLYPPRIYLAHIPEKIIKVANKSIHKKKVSRFQSCTEFRQAIEKLKFDVDWTIINDQLWTGMSNDDIFELSRIKKRSGWTIDLKRNGRRDNNNCHSNLSDDQADLVFTKIIRDTTLS